MRATLFAAVGGVTVLAALALPGSVSTVQAADGSWCATISIGEGSAVKCDFDTYEECRREITGGDRGSCYRNPAPSSAPAPAPAPATVTPPAPRSAR
jgi:Protein of unknown function (DUF3551)